MRRAIYICILGSIACGPMFYQAPPSLGSYPERLPAKRWAQLFDETLPRDGTLPPGDTLDTDCARLPATLADLDAPARLAEIDRLLKLNRDGDYSSARANLLWELRELAADDRTFTAAESYIAWRARPQPKMPARPPADCPWNMEKDDWLAMKAAYANQIDERLGSLTRGLEAAKSSLKPNWLVQRGAFLFRAGRYAEAAADFTAVLPPDPEEPAADDTPPATPPADLTGRQLAAAIMLSRCEIELSRSLGGGPDIPEGEDVPDGVTINPQVPELRLKATTRLHRLIEQGKRHPHPYVPDAHGWLAAIASDCGEPGRAVAHQLDRLEAQPTREITRTVLRECDALFATIIGNSAGPDHGGTEYEWEPRFPAARIARHPLVARLFVQHAIDPAADLELPLLGDNDSGDRYTIDFLKKRILLPRPFIGYALARLGRELLAQGTRLDPVTLTLVAWSSSESGEHEQALALLDQIQADPPSDETLHARATVLRRAGRHAESVAALDRLAALYPKSPLANNLPFQRAVGLFRANRAAESITAFANLRISETAAETARWQQAARENEGNGVGKPDSPPAWPQLQPEHHLIQWLDTLARFAPPEDLAKAISGLPKDDPFTEELRAILRCRAIAQGDFALAKSHLSPGVLPAREEWEGARYLFKRAAFLDAKAWDEHVAPLEKLIGERDAAAPAERFRISLAIARHWLAHRGFLTLPATGSFYYANSQEESQDLLRRRNALELGFPRASVEATLDRMDEATHALEQALAASASDDSAVAAPALELANTCLFRRAEFSLYQKSRALETGATVLSRELHDKLRTRFPDSAEARRAVYYVFTPTAFPWMPGDYSSANSVGVMLEILDHRPHRDPWEGDEATENLHVEISKLPARFDNPAPGTKMKDLRHDLIETKRQLDKLRRGTDPNNQVEVLAAIDRLDDLAAAASLPDITVAEFADYANGRHETLPPQFKSLLDFRERLEIVKDGNGNEKGPANDTIAGWREFLETYPDSPKCEAASLRLTRLLVRQYRGTLLVRAFHFPEAPIPNGYKRIEPDRPRPANPQAALDAILDHQANHSTGRYQDDLDLLRAGALTDAGKPSEALMLLEKILATPSQRDLHPVALLNLGEIALGLLDPAKRTRTAAALRAHPVSMSLTKQLILGDTCLSRLHPLLPWLENRPAK